MISASGIQADLRDVNYYIKKKQGFPSLTDKGVIDVLLGGQGFNFRLAVSKAQPNDRNQLFKLDHVKVNVKNLKIKLKKSKYKILFNVFKPMLYSIVRPAVEKVIESQIRDSFQKADALAYQVQTEAQRASEATREDPENAKSIFSRYIDAGRHVMTEKKKQAEAVSERGTKFQMAMTYHDSFFQDIKMPGGVTNKATEYQELSSKGERWQSPVFNWGGASPSSNLPRVAKITRKPHTTAEGRLQEPHTTTEGRLQEPHTTTEGRLQEPHTTSEGRLPGSHTNGANGHALSPTNGVINGPTNGATNGHATNGSFKKEVDRAFDATGTTLPILGSAQ
jgi:Protein of unknown function (DUF4449)/Family of unknown function (DUF5923)